MPDGETGSFYHCILAARRDLTPPNPTTNSSCIGSMFNIARRARSQCKKFTSEQRRHRVSPLLSLIALVGTKVCGLPPIAPSVSVNNAIVEAACCPSGGNLDQSVRPDRAHRDRHRLLARHRPRHRRTTGRTWRDSHHLIAQKRRLRRDCGRHQSRARARGGETIPANISSRRSFSTRSTRRIRPLAASTA